MLDSRTSRIRGRKLQAIRARWFRLHPLCVRCRDAGRLSPATQLDHIVPLFKGGADFDCDKGLNRQGLCEPCHEAKTAEDMGHRPPGGGDLDGNPTDSRHPWNVDRRS